MKSLQTEQIQQQGFRRILPPWVNFAEFSQKCTACFACKDVCEMQIIIKGDNGLPEIDFNAGRGECSFCTACAKACEVEGLFWDTAEEPWQHKVEIQSHCLAFANIECRSCQDNCESRAIVFRREVGAMPRPQVNQTSCNGCGACISVCPATAIKVVKNEQ